ncbi:MAG: sulfate transporter CysZ, partial [Gammaproteobacteria bacterium]|nr:sulfate transporter CysZ [Gammaproteobacteria bacterium]
YGYLAELTERRLTGQALDDDGDWRQILRDIPRVMGRELQKLAYYLPRALLLLVLGFIPVVNLVVVVLWFLFNAWMMALQYIDYPADNRKVPFAQVRAVMGRARLTTFGFGLPIALLAMVPVVNLVLMPAAVCGGTAYWVAQRQDARR